MACTITPDCIGCQACKKICPTGAVTGAKKELHDINEDACIDCDACGRVCPVRAVKKASGLSIDRIPQRDLPRPLINLKLCSSCCICIDTCPASALDSMIQRPGSKHLFPYLTDLSNCLGCGFCALDCPVDAIDMGSREL